MDISPAAAPLEARFQLTAADFKTFGNLIQKTSGASIARRVFQVLLAVFTLILVASLVFHWRLASDPLAPIARIGADGLAKTFAVLIPIGLFMAIWALVMIRNRNTQLKNPMFNDPTIITLEEDALTQQCGASVSCVEWRDVMRVITSDTHLILVTAPNAGYIVPRRAFNSDAEWQRYVDFARQSWQSAQPSIPPIANV